MPWTWIRMSGDEINGERVAVLSSELGIRPVEALGHLTALSGKVATHRPDGDVRTVPPSLLERWAAWDGEPGAFAAVVHTYLCDPPGVLREWLETMGKLVAIAEKDRRRKKAEYDRERAAAEADQLTLNPAGEGAPPPGSAETSAEDGAALRGDSADSPRPRTYGRTDVRTDSSTGTGSASKASSAEPVVEKSGKSGKSDPLAGLPDSAVRLLSLFYGNANGKRKRDVLEQLHDTIAPVRPGARLDARTWVKARDVAQLEQACALVLHRPPRDLDLGVRWVLQALLDLQKREAIAKTEGASAAADAEERLLSAYLRARAIAVSKWELEHKEEARDLLATAENAVPNDAVEAAGKIGREVRIQHYAALVADRMKFPPFEEWRQNGGRTTNGKTPRGMARVGASL